MCFAAVGTDTGGSIRIPASYCGIAGLKPTYGTVSLEGILNLAPTLDHAGPLARNSSDAKLLLEAMTGQDFGSRIELRGLRFGVIQPLEPGDEPEVTQVFGAACRALMEAGAVVEEVRIAHLELTDPAYFAVLLPEAALLHARWMHARPGDYSPLTRMQLELGFAIPAVTHARALQFRRHIIRQFVKALETVDLLISPTMPWVAPAADPVFAGEEGWFEGRRTVPHNFTGLPALSVNAGFGAQGLPVGIQVIGRPLADALVLGVGAALEALLPQGRPPELTALREAHEPRPLG
jgi:aspartyl-tRNA(Asn)/glutamyl-tRNA(Gln) amidotransferase subunit A